MNSSQKKMRPQNTIGYLSVSKKTPIYIKKTYNPNTNYQNITSSNSNISNEYQFLSRYMSKKKFRGILDTDSPGNKDVLIDSDSEIQEKKRNNSKKFDSHTFKKNGCTKLVIEKVESRVPEKNEEYYKFTNQKRILNKSNTTFFTKKNYVNRNALLRNSGLKHSITDERLGNKNFELVSQSQITQKPNNKQHFSHYQEYINDSIKKNYQNASASYIFNPNQDLKLNKKFFNTGFSYSNKNNNKTNQKISSLTKSPVDYIRVNEDNSLDIRDNSSNIARNFYRNENVNNRDLNSYLQNSSFQNKNNNTRFYYIYKHRNNNLMNKNKNNINEESKKNSLYDNYRDLIKLNTFSKLSTINNPNTAKITLFPSLKEKLIKIQSVWRGAYVRELMTFYWNLDNFKNITNKIINNHIYDYFIEFINNINKEKLSRNDRQKNIRKKYENTKTYNKDSKTLEEYKTALEQKEEDYENLLKNYNTLVERCTELQQKVNHNNIEDSEKSKNKKIIWKELDLDSNNKKMNLKDIQNNNDINNNNQKLRRIKVNRNPNLNEVQRQIALQYKYQIPKNEVIPKENKNKDEIKDDNENVGKNKVQNYYEHFTSNLNIIYENQFILEKNEKLIESPPRGPILKISNFELSLINKSIKQNIPNEIWKIESFDILTKQNSKFTFLEIDQREKISLIISNIKTISIKEICHNNSINLTPNKALKEQSLNKICNNESISLINNKTPSLPKEIHHIDSIYLINKNIPLNEIYEAESLSIINNKNIPINEIYEAESISIINNKKIPINEIYKTESICIINHKNIPLNEIYEAESISIINNKNIPLNEIYEAESISIINNNDIPLNEIYKPESISIIINKNIPLNEIFNNESFSLINNNKNKNELLEESQSNSKIEIKGIEKPKIFENCILDKQNNNIQIQTKCEFNKEIMTPNSEIVINLINEPTNKKNIFALSEENIEQFIIEKTNKNNKNIEIYENERFKINYENDNANINQKNKGFDYISEKIEEIYYIEDNKNKDRKLNIEFIIVNDNNLYIEQIKKNTCDKITEITEELNRIEPNNHYELIFEGIINLNEDITNINKNNLIDKNRQEISYINTKQKNDDEAALDNNNLKKNKNYNVNNEIDKCDTLEINPYEIKRTKNNTNNIFISYENKIEMLNNKNDIFTEKAKKNMMKIILPIRLKTTLRDFIRRNTLPLLINNLKKIALSSYMNKIDNKKAKVNDIKNLLINSANFKWNKELYSLCKEFINNKSIIKK